MEEWLENSPEKENVEALILTESNALQNTARLAESSSTKVLIVVKAQHPLNMDGTPREEYKERLDEALKVAKDCEMRGMEVFFSVFGGPHQGSEIPLAVAGKNYLTQQQVHERQILVHEEVFSGNDEDDLAYSDFLNLSPKEIHVCLSLGQIPRSVLMWITNGVIPYFHPISFVDSPHQSFVKELVGPWGTQSFINGTAQQETEKTRRKHQNQEV